MEKAMTRLKKARASKVPADAYPGVPPEVLGRSPRRTVQDRIDEAVRRERADIIACIQSGTWGGWHEIIEMIRRRSR
jgi:hypothetical protein